MTTLNGPMSDGLCQFAWGGGTYGPFHACVLAAGHDGDHESGDGCTDDGSTPRYEW